MPDFPQLHARVSLLVGDRRRGQWLLPVTSVGVGRGAPPQLRLYEDWLPRQLVRFTGIDAGWLAENGPRTRMRVQNDYVADAYFEPGALVALQVGATLLSWPELDDDCQIGVHIGERPAPDLETLFQPAIDGPSMGTALAVDRVELTPEARTMLAVLFHHLLLQETPPDNLAATAAQRLGRGEQAVKNAANRVKDRINRQRWLNLDTTEQLGYYLVRTSRTLTPDDLPGGRGLPG